MADFQKYINRGAYHWSQIKTNPFKRNAFVLGRYYSMINLVEKYYVKFSLPLKILDVGCGDGVLPFLLSSKFKSSNIYGIDPSKEAIEFALTYAKSKNLIFLNGSAYKIPFEDNFFDCVLSSDVIEHLDDVEQYLNEIKRVVKNNGRVIISTPIRITKAPEDKEHVIEWFHEDFKEVIKLQFADTTFYKSHPVAVLEFYNYKLFRRGYLRLLINIISIFKNPFVGFTSKFKYASLQYSVSKVCK